MGLLDKVSDKVKSKIQSQTGHSSSSNADIQLPPSDNSNTNNMTTNPPPAAKPLEQSMMRYRKQRGINLGSWFVLEQWITPDPFNNATSPANTDLDIAKGKDGKKVLEAHWDSWITDADWKYIKDRGFNSVRLPIGFYHLAAPLPKCLDGTAHAQYRDAWSGAWQRIEKAIETAGKYGLGVLVDLHAAAGGQNPDAHSGAYGKAELFNYQINLNSTALALRFLAQKLSPIPNVLGLELLNEPARSDKIGPWYDKTLPDLRPLCGPDFPLIIHDAWDLPHYTDWLARRGNEFTIIDHHLYRCFSDKDKKRNGDAHALEISTTWGAQFAKWSEQAHGQVIGGEWSSCLAGEALNGLTDEQKDQQRRVFTQAELELFEKNAAGWYYWTIKTNGWSADWNVQSASQAEIMPKRFMRAFKGPPPQGAKEKAQQAATNGHVNYWKANKGNPHPEVYGPGFSKGWDDALMFLQDQGGPQQLGYVYQWTIRRRAEYEKTSGKSLGNTAWEWEHGFKEGVEVLERTCLGE